MELIYATDYNRTDINGRLLHLLPGMVVSGISSGHPGKQGRRNKRNITFSDKLIILYSLDVIISAVPFLADDQRDVHRVAGDRVMPVDFQAQCLQSFFIGDGGGLVRETSQYDAAHI